MNNDKSVNYRLKKVNLAFYEISMANFIADWRIEESKKMNLKGFQMSAEHNRKINRLGALGELAVAKYLGDYWGGTVNTFHRLADVGNNIEVRATTNNRQSLIFRDRDSLESFFFLVIQISEETYKIAGFIQGKDAKKEEFYGSPNERPPAYFVPQSRLIKPTLNNLQRYGLT